MEISGIHLCPRTWKIAFLLSHLGKDFSLKYEELGSPKIFPSCSNLQSDYAMLLYLEKKYDLSELKNFKKEENLAEYGFFESYINCYFIPNVIFPIRHERLIKPLKERKSPSTEVLKEKRLLLKNCLAYISQRLKDREYACGPDFGIADITLGSAIAVLDYFGEIKWKEKGIEDLYHWYLKIKSRASFNFILSQKCQGISSVRYFKDLDF